MNIESLNSVSFYNYFWVIWWILENKKVWSNFKMAIMVNHLSGALTYMTISGTYTHTHTHTHIHTHIHWSDLLSPQPHITTVLPLIAVFQQWQSDYNIVL